MCCGGGSWGCAVIDSYEGRDVFFFLPGKVAWLHHVKTEKLEHYMKQLGYDMGTYMGYR